MKKTLEQRLADVPSHDGISGTGRLPFPLQVVVTVFVEWVWDPLSDLLYAIDNGIGAAFDWGWRKVRGR